MLSIAVLAGCRDKADCDGAQFRQDNREFCRDERCPEPQFNAQHPEFCEGIAVPDMGVRPEVQLPSLTVEIVHNARLTYCEPYPDEREGYASRPWRSQQVARAECNGGVVGYDFQLRFSPDGDLPEGDYVVGQVVENDLLGGPCDAMGLSSPDTVEYFDRVPAVDLQSYLDCCSARDLTLNKRATIALIDRGDFPGMPAVRMGSTAADLADYANREAFKNAVLTAPHRAEWRLQYAENRCENRPNRDCEDDEVCFDLTLP